MNGKEPISRHIVYNRSGFTLDVRLDASGGSTLLAGQVLQREGLPMPEVPLFLVAEDRLLTSSVTGRFGEFRMECPSEDRLRLCLSLEHSDLIEIDLFRSELETRQARDSALLELLLGTPTRGSAEVRLDPGPIPIRQKPVA